MRLVSRKEDEINSQERNFRRGNGGNCRGKLSIVGIGPGALSLLSQKARNTIDASQVIVGYVTYINLLGNLVSGKEVVSSGMRGEITRARLAIEKAREGKKVSIISSGDPGIYGMAGIVLELLKKSDIKGIEIEILPGVTAASACASLLGAPLTQDFAVISLSDLLISRAEIERKLKAALKADFVIVLYNPKSKSRTKPLESAWQIIKRFRSSLTPIGVVKNAYRNGEEVKLALLGERSLLKNIDMATTIIIGNSRTFVKDGYMINPRGYEIKAE